MNFSRKRQRQAPTVIIIALIDVLMVVLIFLVVTTTFKQQVPSVKLALPESKQGKSGATEDPPLIVTIVNQAPHLYIGNRAVTAEKLQEELTKASKGNSQVKLAIRADKGAPIGEVVTVMDAAKVASIKNVSLMTKETGAK
ncbi:MAG: exbD [Verrucomicrobia bacterium]|jgi:biopolymer transport protein ExbD|nr:exbD [Verrucomicrobiota bacterium]